MMLVVFLSGSVTRNCSCNILSTWTPCHKWITKSIAILNKFQIYESLYPSLGWGRLHYYMYAEKIRFIWYPNLQWFCAHWVYHYFFFGPKLGMLCTCRTFILYLYRKHLHLFSISSFFFLTYIIECQCS